MHLQFRCNIARRQLLIIESALVDGRESSWSQSMVDDACKPEHTSCICSCVATFRVTND